MTADQNIAPGSSGSLVLTMPDKIIYWDHVLMLQASIRTGDTMSSIRRFMEPFHLLLTDSIAKSIFPAYSSMGKIPEIFSRPPSERRGHGPLESYIRAGNIVAIAKQAGLETTVQVTTRYRGGDMYSPLISALEDARDYSGEVGRKLRIFNASPINKDGSGDGKEKTTNPDIMELLPP